METEKQKYTRIQEEERKKAEAAKKKRDQEGLDKTKAAADKKAAAAKKAARTAKPKKTACKNKAMFKLTGKKFTAVLLCAEHLKLYIGENNLSAFDIGEIKKPKEDCQY